MAKESFTDTPPAWVLVLLAASAVCAFGFGYIDGRDNVREEAVRRGHAEWRTPAAPGAPIWRWKEKE